MVAIEKEDRLADAKRQGQAQFDSIAQMVAELETAEQQDQDGGADETYAPRQRIEEDALSVQVRSGWYSPGARGSDTKPAEYEILLCTGGPACRIVGDLSEYGEPETARLEVQDWFCPWTEIRPLVAKDDYDAEPIMLAYARCFYFGE